MGCESKVSECEEYESKQAGTCTHRLCALVSSVPSTWA